MTAGNCCSKAHVTLSGLFCTCYSRLGKATDEIQFSWSQMGSSDTRQRALFLRPRVIYCSCTAPVQRTEPKYSRANATRPARRS